MENTIYKASFTDDTVKSAFIHMCSTFKKEIAYATTVGKLNDVIAICNNDEKATRFIKKYNVVEIEKSGFNKGMTHQWKGNLALIPEELYQP